MATTIVHRGVRIVTLEQGENTPDHCRAGDIAISGLDTEWWVYFINEDGSVDGYDEPFGSHNKALWTAKAAAEFDADTQ